MAVSRINGSQRRQRIVSGAPQDCLGRLRTDAARHSSKTPAVQDDQHQAPARDTNCLGQRAPGFVQEFEGGHEHRRVHRPVTKRQACGRRLGRGRSASDSRAARPAWQESDPSRRPEGIARPGTGRKCPVPQPTSRIVSVPGRSASIHARRAFSARSTRKPLFASVPGFIPGRGRVRRSPRPSAITPRPGRRWRGSRS